MSDLNVFQLLIAILIFLVLMFGIGFILNMLLKTTWIPTYLYVGLIVYIYLFYQEGQFVSRNMGYAIWDYIIALAGFGGAVLSGWTIKVLRQKGYRMF